LRSLFAVWLLPHLYRMAVRSSGSPPHYNIAQTDQGWVLIIQNETCSVMQVFDTASSARRAVDRMLEFFDTMSAQPQAAGGLPNFHSRVRHRSVDFAIP